MAGMAEFQDKKPLLSKRNIKVHLSFDTFSWENTLWTDKTKTELFWGFVSYYIWGKTNSISEK